MGITISRSLGSFALLFLVGTTAAVSTAACGSDETNIQGTGDGGPVLGQEGDGSTPGTGGGDGGGGGGGDSAPKPGTCDLTEVTGTTNVSPTFAIYEPPATAPAASTGGTLSGRFKITKAKVFLPTGTKGLANPEQSTGTVNGWAVFDGTKYRIKVDAKLTISSVLGPQEQNIGVNSQGEFKTSGSGFTVDQACDNPKAPNDVEYTYTAGGTTAILVVKTAVQSFGDAYLEIEATAN